MTIQGLATTPTAMQELRDGLLNACSEHAVVQGLPEGADRWLDSLVESAVDEILSDVAVMVDAALARAEARQRAQ